MRTIRVGPVEEFPDRSKRVIAAGDGEIGVFRLGDEFFGWRNVCPHQGGPVCQGRLYPPVRENIDGEMKSRGRLYDEAGLNIVCPWHGLEFDIRTGRHPGAPGMALEPATVRVEAGEVHVVL